MELTIRRLGRLPSPTIPALGSLSSVALSSETVRTFSPFPSVRASGNYGIFSANLPHCPTSPRENANKTAFFGQVTPQKWLQVTHFKAGVTCFLPLKTAGQVAQ